MALASGGGGGDEGPGPTISTNLRLVSSVGTVGPYPWAFYDAPAGGDSSSTMAEVPNPGGSGTSAAAVAGTYSTSGVVTLDVSLTGANGYRLGFSGNVASGRSPWVTGTCSGSICSGGQWQVEFYK